MSKTSNSALQVANSILQRSLDEKNKDKNEDALISHLKLQKLLYILHGWHLAITDEPVFEDEVEAWAYGPVVRKVYKAFRIYGDKPIGDLGGDKTRVDASKDLFNEMLSVVWEKYKGFSSFDLVNATHARGTPWDLARENDEKIIDNDVIRDHYKWLLKRFEDKIEREEVHA